MSEQTTPAQAAAEEKIVCDYPRNMLRVVVQVNDTPENQVAMARIVEAIKNIPIPDSRHSVLKMEQIYMTVGMVSKDILTHKKEGK